MGNLYLIFSFRIFHSFVKQFAEDVRDSAEQQIREKILNLSFGKGNGN